MESFARGSHWQTLQAQKQHGKRHTKRGEGGEGKRKIVRKRRAGAFSLENIVTSRKNISLAHLLKLLRAILAEVRVALLDALVPDLLLALQVLVAAGAEIVLLLVAAPKVLLLAVQPFVVVVAGTPKVVAQLRAVADVGTAHRAVALQVVLLRHRLVRVLGLVVKGLGLVRVGVHEWGVKNV